MHKKWEDEEVELLKKVYPNIENKQLAEYFPERTYYGILWKVKELNLKKSDKYLSESRANNKIYEVNEDYFNTYSHNMFYILGFIAADGCIYSKNGRDKTMQIHLKKEDKSFLQDIRQEMQSSHKIYEDKDSVKLIIGNIKIYDSLVKLGISERKSLTLKFPEIPSEYYSDFIRGYFDGDGSVQKGHYSVKILGTKPFLESLSKILTEQNIAIHSICEANPNKENSSHITYALNITKKKECEKFANYIYQNSGLCLQRKYERFC